MTRLLHPRYWGYHLVVVVALVAAGLLGLWQYHGWQERRTAEARDLTQVAPIPLADAIGPDDPFPGQYVGQPVEVVGTWVPGSTVYVSGREHDGREGYWVVDAVRVGSSLLPVVRGWSPSPGGVPEPAGDVTLVGRLQPSESAAATDDDPTDDVLPQLRVADLAQRFDEDLYGAYVVASEPRDGLVAGRPAAAARGRPAHGDPQPALRHRVVVLRRVRRVRLVAVGTGDRRARDLPGTR